MNNGGLKLPRCEWLSYDAHTEPYTYNDSLLRIALDKMENQLQKITQLEAKTPREVCQRMNKTKIPNLSSAINRNIRRKYREAYKEPHQHHDFWSHPLLIVIIGFLLTAIIGTIFHQVFEIAKHDHELEIMTKSENIRYVEKTHDVFMERVVASMMLASLLYDNESSNIDLVKMKSQYDSAFIGWNKHYGAAVIFIEDLFGKKPGGEIVVVLEETLRKNVSSLDICLTKAYRERLKGNLSRDVVLQCDADKSIQLLFKCVDSLHRQSKSMVASRKGQELDHHPNLIREKCLPYK